MSTVANGVISRRRFLTGLAAAGLAAAAGVGWFARRPQPPGLPKPAAIAADVRAEFGRAWQAYKRLAWGHDELKPVSGGYQEFFAANHPVGLTIVESLDTLYVMELDSELESSVRWIETSLNLDIDAPFQVFETIIRMLGGLLAGHLAPECNVAGQGPRPRRPAPAGFHQVTDRHALPVCQPPLRSRQRAGQLRG